MARAVVLTLLLVECLHLGWSARVKTSELDLDADGVASSFLAVESTESDLDADVVASSVWANISANSNLSGEKVYANVYHVGKHWSVKLINAVAFAGGAYHVAIEAFGIEYGYGATKYCVPGIGTVAPKNDPQHDFYGSYEIGEVNMNARQFHRVVNSLKPQWLGCEYDLLTHNCVSFADALVKTLFGPDSGLPGWMSRLMRIGEVALPTLSNLGAASSQSSQRVSEVGEDLVEQAQVWSQNHEARPQYPNYPRYPLHPHRGGYVYVQPRGPN